VLLGQKKGNRTIKPSKRRVTMLYNHQKEVLSKAQKVLDRFGFCWLCLEARCGKSRIALGMVSGKVLILTKKKAIEGWKKEVKASDTHDCKITEKCETFLPWC